MISFDGTNYVLSGTVILSCGCGGTGPKLKRMVSRAGLTTPIMSVPSNVKLKRYIAQEGLVKDIPLLSTKKYGILYNPDTKQFIDLLQAPSEEWVYSNMRSVA